MPQATTSKTMTSISYLHFLLLISSSSYLAVYTQAAPSHKFNDQQFQTSLHELTIGNTKDGSGHIQIARNHAAQSRRRRDPEALLDWADSQARKMRRRHRGRDLKASGQGKTNRRSEDSMEGSPNIVKRQEIQQGYAELHNLFSDTEYYGTIYVGTPPQPFNVILDTGSADLWLAGSGCTQASGCDATTELYQTSQSSTALQRSPPSHAVRGGSISNDSDTGSVGDDFRISYGSGEASGKLISDSITLAGYNMPNQTFGSCNQITKGLLAGPVSGIMGLGFEKISSSKTKPFWENLAYQNKLGENQEMGFTFTRFLHYSPSSSSSSGSSGNDGDGGAGGGGDPEDIVMPGGVASFGSANQTLYTGDVSWNNVNDAGYWMVSLQDVSIGNTSLGISSDRVAIDTGTSLIGAPASAVDAIFAQVPGAVPSDDPNRKGYYYFPCDTTVRVSFTFNNTIWNIHPSDFNLGRVIADGMCLGAFFSLEVGSTTVEGADPNDGPAWIVGDTFLKNVYSIFRYENPRAVGFARLSDVAKGMSNRTSVNITNHTTAMSSAQGLRTSVQMMMAGLSLVMAMIAGVTM